MHAQIFFNTWESRAFIAKSIVESIFVKNALNDGVVAVGRGTTNSFILKELLRITGNENFQIDLDNYVAGIITSFACASDAKTRTPEVIFRKGVPEIKSMNEAIKEMSSKDIVIKGGNALGSDNIAGVLVAHPEGGTIGTTYAIAISKGIKIIVPISLEKMVAQSIVDIVDNIGGQENIEYTRGLPVGLFPIVGGIVYTEIDAIDELADVETYHIASGGLHEGAGGVTLEIIGSEEEIKKIIANYESIIGTKPLITNLKPCKECKVKICIENDN